jgi:PleD family two-component response regulator
MRLLLIESEPEDVLFLKDVLLEIGESRCWSNWLNIETLEARSWAEAEAILSHEPVDVVLLGLELRDCLGPETFRRARKVAPEIPIILLLSAGEESLGLRLVRLGAQDFLVKKQVDCLPLAHAIESAIERNRLLTAARAVSTHDTLTGLMNRSGFLVSADHDRKLAERLGCRLMVLVIEPGSVGEIETTYGEQRRDLVLVETADHLRGVAGPADLLARIEPARFGMTVFDTEMESIEQAWSRMEGVFLQHRIRAGIAIFSADRPATLETLLEEAVRALAPNAFAMHT